MDGTLVIGGQIHLTTQTNCSNFSANSAVLVLPEYFQKSGQFTGIFPCQSNLSVSFPSDSCKSYNYSISPSFGMYFTEQDLCSGMFVFFHLF